MNKFILVTQIRGVAETDVVIATDRIDYVEDFPENTDGYRKGYRSRINFVESEGSRRLSFINVCQTTAEVFERLNK